MIENKIKGTVLSNFSVQKTQCFSLISMLLLIAISANSRAGLISGPEYAGLHTLYNSTNGDLWTNNSGWMSGDACSWYGITCDQDTSPTDNSSHVTEIVLDGNKLSGSISDLTSFTGLLAFSVGSNQLNGTIPDLSALGHLHDFNASSNRLSGTIPALTQLTNLQFFTVEFNQLTGPIPSLTGLTKLSQFDVGSNQLSGSIPSLNGLVALYIFFADHNQLTGSIPDLTGLTNLQEFYVNSNGLTGSIPALSGLTSLQAIAVSRNQLTGKIPTAPSSLVGAIVCPNTLDTTPSSNDAAWNAATGNTPWWANPYPTNACDDFFTDAFGD